jgi:hypothetical protein
VLITLLVMTVVGFAGSMRLTGEMAAEGQREAARQPAQTPATSAASASP